YKTMKTPCQIYTKAQNGTHRKGTQPPETQVPAKGGAVLGAGVCIAGLLGACAFGALVALDRLLGPLALVWGAMSLVPHVWPLPYMSGLTSRPLVWVAGPLYGGLCPLCPAGPLDL